MQVGPYVNSWKQAISPPRRLVNHSREFLRGVALNAADIIQKPATTPFLRALYCHYVFDDQVEAFERMIVGLKAMGTFVDTNALLEMLHGRRPIPGPCFHLSIDDGFRNIYTNAFPVLQRHGIPATFFVPTALIGVGLELARHYCKEVTLYADVIEMVRWEDLLEMQEAGIEIGSHTRTHARFSDISGNPALLHAEMYESKAELEQRLGRECRSISWPYGTHRDADACSLEAVDAAGYLACFGAFRGQIQPQKTDRLRIPRHHFEAQWPWRHVHYFAQGGHEK